MKPEQIKSTGAATYCPEDNKLRLYVGRVPREEFLLLRAEGWTCTPKQDCNFVAHWTPARRDTALAYGDGYIGDEDQSPADRAADRAERFGDYRDKRTGEATGHADRYDAGPLAHGFQNQARAERAAARHDRIADRAGDAWSKAEYWQRRTAGVISHALHASTPSVRMGRIKELEADLRRMEQNPAHYPNWIPHTRLRLAYENQMIEAQGGRAGVVEMEIGGTWMGRVIAKINKSSATGRVVSVGIIGPKLEGWVYKSANVPGCPFSLSQFETERAAPDSYQPPTDESRAKLAAFEAAKKGAADKRKATLPPCPLVNPTDADAERVQAMLNAAVIEKGNARRERDKHCYAPELEGEPSTICRITQAQYSANSGGAYASAETRGLCANATLEPTFSNMWSAEAQQRAKERGPALCKIRTTSGGNYKARRVIILTDKPQKALPAAVWEKAAAPAPAFALESETVKA